MDDLHRRLVEELYGSKSALREALGLYWDISTAAHSQSRMASEFSGILVDLKGAIDSLPESHRVVLILNVMMGFSTAEVSKQLGKPRSTVIDMVNRALEGIQTYLEGNSLRRLR